ncbi:MAG TPA: metal-dependent hydrolase [Actinomycetota bacterium]|nr:metal-dependent hydrolase [Actinomycetota bacterium]
MLLWHLGVGAALVYVTLGRRRIDYRFILLGAILPDLIDFPLSFVFGWPGRRGPAHTLLAVVVVTVLVLVAFRGQRRLSWFGLGVGWLTHLVGDGMWLVPRTFLWPAFGTRFGTTPPEPYAADLFVHPLSHLLTWGGEVVGLVIVAWFWVAFQLGDPDRRRQFQRDGLLRP